MAESMRALAFWLGRVTAGYVSAAALVLAWQRPAASWMIGDCDRCAAAGRSA